MSHKITQTFQGQSDQIQQTCEAHKCFVILIKA